ncbi:MAG: DNA-protecting protein DprA [Betaproteobacteria bacterium HGW-Betaproteobacteria-14]|nr:MAG: DNA-protecting protein DprA [Betaproteobacteria bacterium HGW-Betaproteobacteria-14]PKO94502.1 MAG: DNA-protecting protein DprA [Betaproteobacteria bacterium HGW-Betaproteobacteria-10]
MPASELADWLRLTLAPGIGGETQRRLLSAFGLPGHIFSASAAVLADTISHKQAGLLLQHDSAEDVAKALAWSNEAGNAILTLADTAYPQCLLDAPDPPTVLYVKGRVELLNAPALAIVGSRNATPQGESNAEAFAAALANAGLTIVSGLALGIDAAAHRGGLRGVGSTIAVIGTGIDRVYPARNQALARDIAASGAIISEFPLGTPALRENFPRRNRVISGLARGCLVVEAAERSGSLITARLAGEQGRDVFAIPGSIHSPLSKGCHKLIKQGAKLVDNAGDILEELGLSAQIETNAAAASAPNAETASLLDCIGHDPLDVDTLASRSGLTAEKLYAILLQMELDGRIASLPGGRFQRIGP